MIPDKRMLFSLFCMAIIITSSQFLIALGLIFNFTPNIIIGIINIIFVMFWFSDIKSIYNNVNI